MTRTRSASRPAATDVPGHALLPGLVARQAALTPAAPAVLADGKPLSYRELDRRANRLAHYLVRRGVGPETLVGVSLRRGADLAVALLGVWKAGAAYVPIDPCQPVQRQAWIMKDTAAGIVLTSEALCGEHLTGQAHALCLDSAWPQISRCPGSAPVVDITPATAAYVIYTSGSTGEPKGVVIPHEGIANRVRWTVARHRFSPADRVLQKTTFSFDAAGWEVFAPLVSGGLVVMAPDGAERDPAVLARAVSEHRITVFQAVPSVLRLLAEEPVWPDCTSLRLIFSAGEPLHADLCQRLTAGLDAELWNTYGPTECSIDVSAHAWEPAQTSGPVPIGRPIDGTRLLVLDAHGEPAPIGMPGELYAGGPGVGRGYLGRPDLTAERFVPDPYGPPGSRLYRTGDRVRWGSDETLGYLGRLDQQVKVNGVRIEPGEVEAALTAHPAVTGAVVAARADAQGRIALAAFVRARSPVSAAELREHLLGRLPEPMVPATFSQVEDFPLTASGKVDRSALLESGPAQGAPSFVAPRTPAEAAVAQIWQRLLGAGQVGADDDFFALGGSSLMLARLAGQLRALAGGEISLHGLFGATTVAAQARLIGPGPGDGPAGQPGGEEGRAGQPRGYESADGHEGRTGPTGIRPVPRTGPLPLSFGQHRLWFLDQLHPGSREWVAPLFLRLPAEVTPEVVQRALDDLERRHEALRTRYLAVDGEPWQEIVPAGPVELRVVDCARADLSERFGEQFERGFDLRHGPLWRAMLARVAGEPHVLLVTLHHIASDGWTTVVLEREIRHLCEAHAAGRDPALPALPVQYADYAVWQRDRLTGEALEDGLRFWRQKLHGLVPHRLPLDHPRPAERDAKGAGVPVLLPPGLAEAIAETGRRQGATMFMTLLAGFVVLLARYGGEWDVPVGVPVADRGRPEVRDVAGFFLNSLVLRCGLTGEETFEQAIAAVRAAVTAAFAHQDVPFERLVDDLAPERDLSRTPLYQVAFDLQEEGATSVVEGDDTAREAFQRAWQVAKTDLTLFMWHGRDGSLTGALEYATSLFEPSTVERMAGHFVRLLAALTTDPTARLRTVPFLTEEERRELTERWNPTPADGPAADGPAAGGLRAADVPAMFERQAAATPRAPALRHGDTTVTYAELDRQAGQICRVLRERGAGPESLVAVGLDPGPGLIACLLGAWKAGAAFLPLDPAQPADRIRRILAGSGASLAITQPAYRDSFPAGSLLTDDASLLTDDAGPVADGVAAPPGQQRDPDQLAYVIFTSGSTGRPKGVMVTHRALANHVRWAATELAGRGSSGAPLFTSVAFDLVVPSIWAPLVTGQPVTLLPQDLGVAGLGAALAGAGPFSFIKLTPSHLEVLSQLPGEQAARLAATFVVAGEALPAGLAGRWSRLLGGGRLINEYGPTEATVGTCIYPVARADTDADAGPDGVVPIGYPLPGMAMYVLDPDGQPVPLGVRGELFVGGTGVARGYVGRPDLTAERFVPDPYGPPGGRLYRTGDLVRRRADGAICFLGRLDDQIKLRGYRVEPGEVAEAVLRHPGVRAAFVGSQAVAGDTRLIAYYAPGDVGPEDLGRFCATLLPGYLLPSAYVPLDALPLTPNGKVDRAALPVPDGRPAPGGPAAGDAGTVSARTVAEERIAAIWKDLLGADPVGTGQSFFELGGHSILAIRLVARLQEEFDIDVPVRAVFEHATIAAQARAVEERIRAEVAEADSEEREHEHG